MQTLIKKMLYTNQKNRPADDKNPPIGRLFYSLVFLKTFTRILNFYLTALPCIIKII